MKAYKKEWFLRRAKEVHGNKYNYEKIEYVNLNTKITIICPRHGEFQQKPSKHLIGQDCRKCMKYKLRKKFQLSKEEFLKRSNKTHNNKYDYSKVNYINAHRKVIIICPDHGEFYQIPNCHMRKNGCPRCAYSNKSKQADEWLSNINNIEQEKIIYIKENKFLVDGFNKRTNTIYEYYGDFWHGNPKLYKSNELNKRLKIKFGELYNKTIERAKILINEGYSLIYKWETDHDMKVGEKFNEE